MSDVTVRQLAQVLGMTQELLLTQLSEAGMKFTGPDQVVTSTEKVKLLGFLRRTHGKKEETVATAAPSQITLKRKHVGELTVSSGAAKGKTVNIEVRQKRTYVKRSEVEDTPVVPEVDSEREHALKLLAESKARNESSRIFASGGEGTAQCRHASRPSHDEPSCHSAELGAGEK